MGVRTADEMGMRQAHYLDVVDVTALAGNETAVFLAHNACANAFNAHVLSSQPELLFPPFPSKRGLEFWYRGLRRLFGCLRDLHAAGRVEHRFDDVMVAGAAADVAFQLLPDGGLVELAAIALHDIDRRHDHAGGAIAALQAVIVAERGLHRVQFVALGDALDRGDAGAGRLAGQYGAGFYRPAVD